MIRVTVMLTVETADDQDVNDEVERFLGKLEKLGTTVVSAKNVVDVSALGGVTVIAPGEATKAMLAGYRGE